jgi:hypothetical protein
MTVTTESRVERLVGWSIVAWSFLPRRMFAFELINFHVPSPTHSNIAKVIFVNPARVSIQGFKRQPGEEVVATLIRVQKGDAEVVLFELDASCGGRAVIEARDINIISS